MHAVDLGFFAVRRVPQTAGGFSEHCLAILAMHSGRIWPAMSSRSQTTACNSVIPQRFSKHLTGALAALWLPNLSSSHCYSQLRVTSDRMVSRLHLQGRASQALLPRRRRAAVTMVHHSHQPSPPAVRSCLVWLLPPSPPRATPLHANLQRTTSHGQSVLQAGRKKDRDGLGRLSTAQDVLVGKDLSGMTFFVSGGNSGIGCAAMFTRRRNVQACR